MIQLLLDANVMSFYVRGSYPALAARLRMIGKPLDTADAMIAAHALATGSILVSNDAVFPQVEGLRVEDWTKGPEPV